MVKWKEGNLNDLLLECRSIQSRLPKSRPVKAEEKLARTFSNLMFAGKCKSALNLLSQSNSGGILHLHDYSDPANPDSPSVREVHPMSQPALPNCILQSPPIDPHPVIFESINAATIRSHDYSDPTPHLLEKCLLVNTP